MSKFTVNEKIRYNRQRNDDFSLGYSAGVLFYRTYPGLNREERKQIDTAIAEHKAGAKKGDPLCKGVLCGMRDTANERKAKAKKKP